MMPAIVVFLDQLSIGTEYLPAISGSSFSSSSFAASSSSTISSYRSLYSRSPAVNIFSGDFAASSMELSLLNQIEETNNLRQLSQTF